MAGSSRLVDFEREMCPLLASVYERGRLVPFLGAGMSCPACALWPTFLENLERAAGREASAKRGTDPTARAHLATAALRNKSSLEQYWQQLRDALQPRSERTIPPQTRALAQIWWPLVITTNYDDLFLTATQRSAVSRIRYRRRWPRQPMTLVSRDPQDCRRVLGALSEPLIGLDDIGVDEGPTPGMVVRGERTSEVDLFDRETGSYLWHIQGFLGGQADPKSKPELRTNAAVASTLLRPQRFLDDLVVGHAEYRRVINTEIQFRRCFGEVFRQRSFLFLGSSLAEDYFLNLFGEILELYGSNSYPHFAFVKRGSVEKRFLLERMNVLVCEYSNHAQLPIWINSLRKMIDGDRCRATRFSFSVNSPFWIPPRLNEGDLTIVRSALPFLKGLPKNECVAVSAGRMEKGAIWVGPEIRHTYLQHQFSRLDAVLAKSPLPPGNYVSRLGRSKCYAVAARDPQLEGKNARSLVHVNSSVQALLDRAWKDAFEVVHLHLAAGRIQVFPSTLSLVETTRAYGQWRRHHLSRQLRLMVYVLDPLVLFNVSTGRVSLHELLSVDSAGFWLEVVSQNEQVMRIPVQYRCETRLGEILEEFCVPPGSDWHVQVRPSPRQSKQGQATSTQALAKETLTSLGIVPGSTLVLLQERARKAIA